MVLGSRPRLADTTVSTSRRFGGPHETVEALDKRRVRKSSATSTVIASTRLPYGALRSTAVSKLAA